MLVTYLVFFGPTGDGAARSEALSTGQEVLLGLGSTLGIVVQFLVLVPYLRASGFTYRPRFDFRDPELAKTLSLGSWTVLFVVVTQAAYLVVVKLASGGTVDGGDGTGYLVYSNSLLIMMVPHAIVTVSLATAILPRLSSYAHEGRLPELGRTVGSTLRTALALVLPFAVLLPIMAGDVAGFAFGWDNPEEAAAFAPTLAVFGPALVVFTVHYFMLRGFYAMEMTRLVFFIQLAVSATNVVVALLLVPSRPPEDTAPMLVVAYLASYTVGAVVSFVAPPPHGRRPGDPAAAPVPGADGPRAGVHRRRRLGGGARPRRDGRVPRTVPVAAARRPERGGRDADLPRRGPPAAGAGGHQPGRHRRGAPPARVRLLRVGLSSGTGEEGGVSDADVDAGG